jgi:hypothetical protein
VREKNQIPSGGRYVHFRADRLLGLPLYHISRYMASTFKRLATTTTHCDLNNFYQNGQGKPPGHDTAHDPVHYPYSDCRIVNMQLLYRASDRKSLDFYRSYLAEHLSEKDSGTIHWIPRIYATRVSFQLLDIMQDK